MVKVITAKVCVAVGGFYLKDTIPQFKDGYIKCAATKVKYGHLHIFILFVKAIGEGSRCRLINDPFYLKPRNFTGFFGRLPL